MAHLYIRFDTDELSEVLRGIGAVPPLSLAFFHGPGHLDLFRHRIQHILLLIRIQAPHADHGMPVLHQLGLGKCFLFFFLTDMW